MTPDSLRLHLERDLHIGILELGRLMGTDGRTARRWASGGQVIPACVQQYVLGTIDHHEARSRLSAEMREMRDRKTVEIAMRNWKP